MQPLNFDFSHIDRALAEQLALSIADYLKGHAVQSFSLGCTYPHYASADDVARYKKDFQAQLTTELERALEANADPNDPDLQTLVEFDRGIVTFHLRPVYIGGHYTKASRVLAQTIHYCLYCKGRGCPRCHGKGRTEYLSVQEKIAPFFEKASGAQGNAFHGAGREDVDVRMLGKGRPFVLELWEPRTRFFDLDSLENEINRALEGECGVHELHFTNRAEVARIKEGRYEKIYRAIVQTTLPFDRGLALHLIGQSFDIAQRTPTRVEHRRVDLVRKRKATILELNVLSDTVLELVVRTDAGLYVKEFVSGDHKRSEPSLASLLGTDCRCIELDVLEIVENA